MAGVETIEENLDEIDERLSVSFTQSKRLVCIEYPGCIDNITKALETLGGEKNVDTILKDPFRRVGLRFRPKDPYSKQVFGDRFPVNDVLMKVKRKKRKKKETDQENEDVQYECELLGVVDTLIKFKSMADFQYLAPDVPDLLGEIHGSEILDIDTPLHLPPSVFARVDHPFDYQYRKESQPKDKDNDACSDHNIGPTTRKRRPNYGISCGFYSPKVPGKPKEGALKEIKRYNNDGLDIVQRLFNVRPVWSRKAVAYHLGKKDSKLRLLLPCVAYYWIAGPWRTLWTKFGYDPRKNPAAKMYQKLDFRLRASKALRGMKLPPTIRSIYDFSLHTGFQKTRSNTVVPTGIDSNPEEGQPSTSREESVPAEDEMENNKMTVGDPEILPYVFYPDRLPPARQVIYQLCDIRCAEAQELISANDGKETECTMYDGWLSPGTSEKVRKVLTNCLIALFEKQKAAADRETGSTSQEAGDEQLPDIEDDEATFLDTLMEDDDVEAYDILDEEF